MTYHAQFLLLVVAGWVNRQQQDVIDYLQEENRVLRAGLRGKRLRLSDDDRRRLAVKAQALGREALARLRPLPHPLRFCVGTAASIAVKYDGSKNRSPGRPPTAKDIRELIVRVARENPTWGYTRLRGALKNLGHELGRNTIKRLLAEHGIAPAPERGRSMSWSTFLKAHWGAIAATDLFTVEVVNPFGLVRYHVLFVIDIATRCVCIGGITSDPNGEWMKQVARNLTDMWDGFLLGKRYLIHDRDPLFTEAVRGLLRDSGVKPLRLPANSPNLNAYAERFVLSIRRECLDRFVPLNERHLRRDPIRLPPAEVTSAPSLHPGPQVLAGRYTVRIELAGEEVCAAVEVREDPRFDVPIAAQREKLDFLITVGQRVEVATETVNRLRYAKRAVDRVVEQVQANRGASDNTAKELASAGGDLKEALTDVEVLFTGDTMNFYLDGGPQRIQGMESWPDDVLPQLLDLTGDGALDTYTPSCAKTRPF